jgi:hypothetical protein
MSLNEERTVGISMRRCHVGTERGLGGAQMETDASDFEVNSAVDPAFFVCRGTIEMNTDTQPMGRWNKEKER